MLTLNKPIQQLITVPTMEHDVKRINSIDVHT